MVALPHGGIQTKVRSATQEVRIGGGGPTVLIGERINPSGKKKLAAAIQAGDLELVRQEALGQVHAGADILDVNVGMTGVDEVTVLPAAVRIVMETVPVPLCIDSENPEALAAALKVYRGKPLINSVSGQEWRLKQILPLVKEYGAAVIGLAIDDNGIPKTAEQRLSVSARIVERATAVGIPREDIVIDSLALTTAADHVAGLVVLETIRLVHEHLGVNQTLGASNISFGLPDREIVNGAFLALAIAAGVTCPVVDAAKVQPMVLATDLLLGRDKHAMRYIRGYRRRMQNGAG